MFLRGGTQADVPKALDEYGQAIVNWRTQGIVDAIEGTNTRFETPLGELREPVHAMATSTC